VDEGAGEEAVDVVKFSGAAGFFEILGGAGAGEEAGFVFVEVIPVGADEAAEHPSAEGGWSASPPGTVEVGDLEVDEPGFSIGAVEDVFAFVGIDVGDAAFVDGFEESREFIEKIRGEGHSGVEVCAGDEFVEEAGGTDAAEEAGNSANALELLVNGGFVIGDESAEPFEGKAVEGMSALDFENDEFWGKRRGVGGGGVGAFV
jgi:hypothetical protein